MVHAPVIGAEKPVPADKVPSQGALALAPLGTPLAEHAVERYASSIAKASNVKVQKGAESINDETRALVWLETSGKGVAPLDELLAKHKGIGWIQLGQAGITLYIPLLKKYPERLWTSCKGAFSQPVAEHALMLTLSLLRYIPMRIHATSWGPTKEATLFDANVLILGAGGITLSLLSLLAPFTPTVTVLRRRADPIEAKFVPEALQNKLHVGTLADLNNYIPHADVVIVNCALTSETKHALSKEQFDKMKNSAIVVNVARGEVIHTDDLVDALQHGKIFGAGLDVTDPEPLPDNHPLWSLNTSHPEMDAASSQGGKRANVIITPHVANTLVTSVPLYEQRVLRNVEAWTQKSGRFEGLVDVEAGY